MNFSNLRSRSFCKLFFLRFRDLSCCRGRFQSSKFHFSTASSFASSASNRLFLYNSPSFNNYVESLTEEHRRISDKLNQKDDNHGIDCSFDVISQRLVELEPIVDCYQKISAKKQDLKELDYIINDAKTDSEMCNLAKEDRILCQNELDVLKEELLELLTPREKFDFDEIVLEVTAGVGGLEAMLFGKELFEMYQSYVQFKGWDQQFLDSQDSELGGLRHGSMSIRGNGAYSYLKFEGGVHRVQRIPQTEKSGRIHTSTVTVAILPQPLEIEINIDSKDLKIETKRASGAGGQHVNKTDSAVRITHLPSGIVVESQAERSQPVNKAECMKKLRAKLYQRRYEEQLNVEQSSRKIQVGTSGRSEKIRTYNFVQDRITDHRIGINCHHIVEFLNGEKDLDRLIEQMLTESRHEILLEMIEKNKKQVDNCKLNQQNN